MAISKNLFDVTNLQFSDICFRKVFINNKLLLEY